MVAKSQDAGCVFHSGKLSYDLKAKSISHDAFRFQCLIFDLYFNCSMKKYLLILLCLLTLRLDATPTEPVEPVGQRLGLSLIEVLDSIYKEGIYHYTGSSGKPRTPDAPLTARFQDKSGERSLNYGFVQDKCDLAMLVLPLSDLDFIVQLYDRQFTSVGKQM
jgi:hypothetical protein